MEPEAEEITQEARSGMGFFFFFMSPDLPRQAVFLSSKPSVFFQVLQQIYWNKGQLSNIVKEDP